MKTQMKQFKPDDDDNYEPTKTEDWEWDWDGETTVPENDEKKD